MKGLEMTAARPDGARGRSAFQKSPPDAIPTENVCGFSHGNGFGMTLKHLTMNVSLT